MWCGRENCLNKAYFARKMEGEKDNARNSSSDANQTRLSKDFKIALAAMTSAEDYNTLMSQIGSGN